MLPPFRRLPIPRPGLFYAAAVAMTGLLAVTMYGETQRAADRMMALRDGPPPPVTIETFDAARDGGSTGEVVIVAQVDMTLPMQLVYRDGTGLGRALAYPVLATTAQRGDAQPPVLGFFHIATELPDAEILDFARIMPAFAKVGDFGPIVALNGEIGASPAVVERVSTLMTEAGRATTEPLLRIAPYAAGREVALAAPRRGPLREVWMALIVAFVGMGISMGRVRPVLIERRRLARIADAGRKRSGIAPEMCTPKGRSRLAPLASHPDTTEKANGPLGGLVQDVRERLMAIRSPR